MTKTLQQQLDEAYVLIGQQARRIDDLEALIQGVAKLLEHAKASVQVKQDEQPIQWVNVIEVECADFYSSSSKTRRPMWRLRTDDGRKVNLFDHSDPLRDNKPLLQDARYFDTFAAMDIGEVDRWTTSPIQVELKPDGNFWKVVKIKPALDGVGPDFSDDSDDDELEPDQPRRPIHRMFYPQGSIDLKEDLWDMKRAAGHYDDVLGPVGTTPLAVLKQVVKRGNFVILDTETTGLGTDAEICQIAIISPTGEKLLDTLVKPKKPIPADATRIHKITNDMVKTAPDWLNTNEQVWQLLKGRDVIVYNAEYDFRLIAQSEKASDPFALSDWHTISRACAMEAYAEWNGDWNEHKGGYRWSKLVDAVPTDFQMPTDVKAHSAFGDCLMTLAVCRFLVDQS